MMNPVPMTAVESTLVTPSATLPLERCSVRVEARGGIARVILEQTFKNHHAGERLRVQRWRTTY